MNRLKQLLGIDLRTLAVFRMALGTMLIVDLATRAVDLRAHYTDFGILPRDFWLSPQAGTLRGWELSIHLASGTAWFQALLFVIAGILALMLVVGYRSRLASVASWLLLLSLQNRNIYIMQGSDVLLLLMLLWGMFLPLGARWSVDAALSRDAPAAPNPYISVMGVGLLLQVVSVYFFTALLKDSTDWWPDGIAVFYSTHYAQWLSPMGATLGVWLEQHTMIARLLSYFVWFFEILTPLLLFLPIYTSAVRLVTLFLLMCMHVAFWLFLEVGLFPPISMTSLLVFTPSVAWDWIRDKTLSKERLGLRIYYDSTCEFCEKTCYLLRMIFALNGSTIAAADTQTNIQELLEQHNSWVVMDHNDSIHLRWNAMIVLFERSIFYWPLSPIAAFPPISRLGDRIYDWIAEHRPMLGRWSARWLPWRRVRVDEPPLVSMAGIVLIVLLVVTNFESLEKWPVRNAEIFVPFRQSVRFYQHWNMFSPSPIGQSLWIVVEGKLSDGTTIDVLNNQQGEIDWERPIDIANWYSSYRWRKYFHTISSSGYEWYQWHWGHYVCRRWNENASGDERLQSHTIYWMAEALHPGWEGRRSIKRYEGQTITCAQEPT